eukprot:jgi/Botrbrau1/3791/Bobra.0183s0024.1
MYCRILRSIMVRNSTAASQQKLRPPPSSTSLRALPNTTRIFGCRRTIATSSCRITMAMTTSSSLRKIFQSQHAVLLGVAARQACRTSTVFTRATSDGQLIESPDFPGRQLLLSHILVPLHRKNLMDSLEKQFVDGAAFADLAKAYSTCPSSEQGGKLGWVSRGKLVKEAEEAAFQTPVGGVVRCETNFGLHLFYVSDERKMVEVEQMGPLELAELLEVQAASPTAQFVDVREPDEHQIASLPHFVLKPMSRMGEWGEDVETELDPKALTVVLCHHGVRSMRVATVPGRSRLPASGKCFRRN